MTGETSERLEPTDEALAQRLSWRLLDAVRGVGLGRGLDLALRTLFVRWVTLTEPEHENDWDRLAKASSGDEERMALLSVTARVFGPEFAPSANDTDLDVLRPVLVLISQVDSTDAARAAALLRASFEELLTLASSQTRESGERETPESLANLLVRMVVRDGDTVLDPACGQGNDLLAAGAIYRDVALSGIEMSAEPARIARMRLQMAGLGNGIRRGDAFNEVSAGVADAVLLQPPWGLRLTPDQGKQVARWAALRDSVAKRQNPKSVSKEQFLSQLIKGDYAWLLLAHQALRPGGRAAVVLTKASLGQRHSDIQRYLVETGLVEAIVALPAGVFAHAGIPTVVWLLRNPEPNTEAPRPVLMIDTEPFFEATSRTQLELTGADELLAIIEEYRATGNTTAPTYRARAVALNELEPNKGLLPQTYLAEPPVEAVSHPTPEHRLLTRIGLENFKSFGERVSVPLAPLTLVFGANSAGKSSVIQSLLLLKQSIEADRLITQGQIANLGSFNGLVHRHNDQPVTLGIEYGALPAWLPETGTPDPALHRQAEWQFSQTLSGAGMMSRTTLRFGPHEMAFTASQTQQNDQLDTPLKAVQSVFLGIASGTLLYPFDARHLHDGSEQDEAKRLRGRESNAKRALKRLREADFDMLTLRRRGILPTGEPVLPRSALLAHSDHEQGIVSSYMNRYAALAAGMAAEIRELLDSVVYLGPLRSAPQRFYDRTSASSTPGDGHHVAMYLFDNSAVLESVNEWMDQLEIPYALDAVPVKTSGPANLVGDLIALALTDKRSGVSVTPADVGFGISQALPVIVETLSQRETVICVEQPETHLHPRLQARLADLFIESTQEGGRGNQMIVETHSEHLMLRVQRRIREGSLNPAQVSVVYVDQDTNGHTSVNQLRIDSDGDFLDEWPNGFFDERLDELFGTD